MALDRELRRLLEYANAPETDNSSSKALRPTARNILDQLTGIYTQTCVPCMGVNSAMNLPELLVLTAETAIFQNDFATASESVEWFFSESKLKNQFYCRAQFVRAHCSSDDAQSDTGLMKLKKVLNAVHFILAVLPIATESKKRPTYDFLVYNASVTYWQIARQLMKQSTFQFLVPSLVQILDALKLTAEADVKWLLRLQLALVYAQVDANQLTNAAKSINDVVDVQITSRLSDVAKDESFKAMYEEALRLQVHIGSLKDPECQKIVPNVKRLLPPTNKRSSLLVKLQCIRSGNLTGSLEAAYIEIFQETTNFLTFTLETTLDEVKTFVESLESRAFELIDTEIIVETAIHAAFNSAIPIAATCEIVLQRKGKNSLPRIRVLCQVLSAILLIIKPVTRTGKISTRQRQTMALTRRVEGMKAFERALLASKRQQDAELVERVCIYAWNLSLPLIQPHLQTHLSRVFSLSSATLEEMDSLLLGLRARLYLETAKLEVASDYLTKANSSIKKALSLDYGTIIRSNEASPMTMELLSTHEDWIERPVDTHLLPVKQKLDLKLVAESSSSKTSEVLTMLEQVKDGKDLDQQRSTLARCIVIMTEMSSSLEVSDVADHIRLWNEISTLAWRTLQDGKMAQQAVETALARCFPMNEAGEIVILKPISNEKSLMILEVDMRLLLVEILASKLKDQAIQVDKGKSVVSLGKETYVLGMHRPYTEEILSTETEEDDKNSTFQARQTVLNKEIQATKSEILNHLTRALQAATLIGWPFVLENVCIYLWNYHFHIFRLVLESSQISTEVFDPQWILPECVGAFEGLYTALEAAATIVDNDLLAHVGLGLSSIYEKTGRLEKASTIADSFLKRKSSVFTANNCVNVLHLKRFAELKSRIQIAQNVKEIVPMDSNTAPLKVVAYLEAMEVTFRQILLSGAQESVLMDKAQGFYQKAVAIWQTCAPEVFSAFMSNDSERLLKEDQGQMELYVEIWVRIGCGAFRLRNVKFAIECAEHTLVALRPDEGKKTKQMTQLLVVPSTWKWFALAELLYGRAILALGQGETPTQKLLLASFTHLVQAIEYGLRGNTTLLVHQACQVVWNATIAAMNGNSSVDSDESNKNIFLERIVEHLRKTLRYLDQVIASPEFNLSFYGKMVLLTLSVFEKADKWSDQFEICENVLKHFGPTSHRPLSSGIMKEIRTASAISGAHLGKSSSIMSKSGGGSKSPDQLKESQIQAQILKKVAFSSWKDPPAQLKALSNAYIELDGQTEEQSLVLVDIAEWFFTNQLPVQNADNYLECATSNLLTCQKQTMAQKASTGQLTVAPKQKSIVIFSPLWFAEKLIRIFVMRAKLSQNYNQRSKHIRMARNEVDKAWEYIIIIANENEFKAEFDHEKTDNKVENMDFNEWKKDKTPKYIKPISEKGWVLFLTDKDEDADNRFYVLWTKVLQSVQIPNTLHITQPVLTLAYLEDLLTMLRSDGLQYLSMVPVFCLYAVLYHAYIPQRTYIAQIWLDLTQFDLMERLNLSTFSLPLQNALNIIQTQGDTLIKDLQEAQVSTQQPKSDFISRNRHILHSTRLDTHAKVVASIQLLIKFGFVRQAKTLMEILRYSIERSDATTSTTEAFSECEFLSSLIFEIEGKSKLALERMKNALECSQIHICRLLEWTLYYCKLNADLDESLRQLQITEKIVAKSVVATLRRPSFNKSPHSGATNLPDLKVVELMAHNIFKQAQILLKKAISSELSTALVLLQGSKRELERSMKMLIIIDADYCRSKLLQKYSRALRLFKQKHEILLTDVNLNLVDMLQEVVTLQEKCLTRQYTFPSSLLLQTERHERETMISPLKLSLALTKMQFARLLMEPEMSPATMKERNMTWYNYYENSQRNVVEKWLTTTESLEKNSPSVLPQVMILFSSAIELLGTNSVFEIEHTIAQVLKLQCQRLALFHRDDTQTAEAIRHRLWTRYTSSDSPHTTWVCCHGAQAELAAAAQNPASVQLQDDPEVHEEEGVSYASLDEILSVYAKNLQTFQLVAFEKQCTELLRLCSNELIQVWGCRNPFDCAKNVLKHQSAQVIDEATILFEKCVSESNVQRLHLRRMKKLRQVHTSAETHSLPFQLSQLYLSQQSESYKRMSVGTQVDTIVAALPSNIRVLCLHFSPDRCFLYAGLLSSTENCVAVARMEFTDTQTKILEQIQKKITIWREKCAKMTLAYEEIHNQDEMYEFKTLEGQTGDDVLEEEFTDIINATIELFNPLFTHSAMNAELSNNLAGNTLILLLDRVLASLPMEALPALVSAEAIARDFSIQILYYRLIASKKQRLKSNEIRVIVDSHKEDVGDSSGQTLTSVVKQCSGEWKDAFEHGQIPSVTDWQQTLLAHRGGGLLYVGPNRVLGSYLPLQQLTGMNIALTCQAMILLDHAENASSARRQSKLDSEKRAWEKEVECDPYARALLFTLSGVNVLVINQWATTFNGNRRLAGGLLQNITKGFYVGKALKKVNEATIAVSTNTSTEPTSSPATVSDGVAPVRLYLKNRFRYNAVIYGLANMTLKGD